MKYIFQVWVNEDGIEGRGRQIPFAAFTARGDAYVAAQGRGPMGASDGEVREVVVYDSIKEYNDKHEETNLRESALRKLTAAERKVLGF